MKLFDEKDIVTAFLAGVFVASLSAYLLILWG